VDIISEVRRNTLSPWTAKALCILGTTDFFTLSSNNRHVAVVNGKELKARKLIDFEWSNIKIVVFWFMTTFGVVDGIRLLGETFYLHFQS
jgi:hypothetical protein